MQKLITILLITAASLVLGCDNNDPGPQKGCLTAIPKVGAPDRIFLRCCTQEEFNSGSNVAAGGTAGWDNYTGHQWVAVSSCDKCN